MTINPDIYYLGQLVFWTIIVIVIATLLIKVSTALNNNITPEAVITVANGLRQVADNTFKQAEGYAKSTDTPIDDAILAIIRETVITELNKFIPSGSTVTVTPPNDTQGVG